MVTITQTSINKRRDSFLVSENHMLQEYAKHERSNDVRVLVFLLLPAFAVAGSLYLVGARLPAIALAASAFAVSAWIAPEIGLYGYLAWQALDPMFIAEQGSIFTPSKALGPFLLLLYVLPPWRRRTPLLVSRGCITAVILFGLYGAISCILAPEPYVALRNAGQIIVQGLLLIVAIHTLRTRAVIGRGLFFAVVGGLAAALVMLTGGISEQFRRGTIGAYANPNTTAVALSVALMCVPAAWGYVPNIFARISLLAAAPLILTAILKTGSRGAVTAIIATILISGIFTRGSRIVRRLFISILCVIVTVSTIAIVWPTEILDPISRGRLESIFQADETLQTESRFYIWQLTFETYLKYPWGFGLGNTQFVLAQEHGFHRDAHSTYLSVLVDGGVIGCALFIWAGALLLRAVWRIRQPNPGLPAKMMLIFVGLYGLTHTIHFAKYFWIPVMICLLLAEQMERERRALSQS